MNALHDTIHIVEEYLKADAFAGVSREHLRMQDLEAAYQQSILALNNVFYSRNRVNCFDPQNYRRQGVACPSIHSAADRKPVGGLAVG